MNTRPFGLSDRQVEVLTLVAEGKTTVSIGVELGIAENTVRRHLLRMGRQMNCRNRASMVALAYQHQILVAPGPASLPPDMTAEMVALARMVMSNRPLGMVRASAKRVADWADGQRVSGRAA